MNYKSMWPCVVFFAPVRIYLYFLMIARITGKQVLVEKVSNQLKVDSKKVIWPVNMANRKERQRK